MFKRVLALLFFILFGISETLIGQSYYDFEIESIKFSGNSFFSESELKKNIESKETPMWFWVFLDSFTPFGDEPVYFDSSNISIDILALKELYRSYGFFNTQVNHFIVIDSSNNSIELNYQIIESQ
ncbi:MAG: POTRA domain-containing protein, partial [Ignavibacteria bacterium]|nr:POTRA domain-containing protein [Ignavibacteria bacterium]